MQTDPIRKFSLQFRISPQISLPGSVSASSFILVLQSYAGSVSASSFILVLQSYGLNSR